MLYQQHTSLQNNVHLIIFFIIIKIYVMYGTGLASCMNFCKNKYFNYGIRLVFMYVQFVYTYSKCLRLYAQHLYACAFCEY